MKSLDHIPYALEYRDPEGRLWHPYAVKFTSPDGTYECHIYAISDEHAQLQLEALQETGELNGQSIGCYPANAEDDDD